LVMALIERCRSAWHMLIERLIYEKFIKSGVQVSIDFQPTLKFGIDPLY